MAVITMPSTLPLGAGSGFGQQHFDLVGASESTGSEQARPLGPPRWTLALAQPANLTLAQSGAWLAMLAQLRGKVNHLLAWDPARVQPLGTYRGSPTLTGSHAIGATSLSIISGTAIGTLKAGDWLQIGSGLGTSQLVMVTVDATANGAGSITVSIEPALRIAFANLTAVTWLRASTYFRLRSDGTTWRYAHGGGAGAALVSGIAIDLMESWS